ncbi:MAG: response regulator, partial [Chloroflexota bacterium]
MSHTILIIEDSPDNMMIVSMILQSMGYNTIEATNGVMGLEMVKTHQPDVVLMDYHLPGINGHRFFDVLIAFVASSPL